MASGAFVIGDRFSASDPVARFVVVLAMIWNEWNRSTALMPKVDPSEARDEDRGVRLMLTRQQAAAFIEAAEWIEKSRRLFPNDIGPFLDRLGAEAKDHLQRALAALEPKSEHYLDWLKDHRNVTAHFPKLHPLAHANGDEEIGNALGAAADLVGSVDVAETYAKTRFHFADVVSVQLLPDITENPDEIKKLSEASIALGFFAFRAIETYLNEH